MTFGSREYRNSAGACPMPPTALVAYNAIEPQLSMLEAWGASASHFSQHRNFTVVLPLGIYYKHSLSVNCFIVYLCQLYYSHQQHIHNTAMILSLFSVHYIILVDGRTLL